MMAPGENFADYMLDLTEHDFYEYSAQRDQEIKLMSLKSGWCMTNHHHICPKIYVDPKTPGCDCPCHSGEPKLDELDGWDLI